MILSKRKEIILSLILFSLFFIIISSHSIKATDVKIAVLPVREGNVNWYGWNEDEIINGITEKITNKLVDKAGISVVERSQIEKVMNEQNFGMSGRIDSSTAGEIGEILGVNYLLTSAVTQMQVEESGGIAIGPLSVSSLTAFVNITGRIIDTKTAEIVDSVEAKSKKKESSLSVDELRGISFGSKAFSESVLGKSIDEAVDLFVGSIDSTKLSSSTSSLEGAAVVKIMGDKLIINAGSSDGIEDGQTGEIIRLVEVESLNEAVKMPIGEVEVFSAKNKSSAIVTVINIESGKSVQKGDTIQF